MVAAEATTRLRVGPLVLNNEFHHPALLARTAATLDRLTGGRLVLGLGTGYTQSEHDAIGMLLREPAARVTRFEESVIALRSLLDTGAVEMDGDHHHLAISDLGVRPVQEHVPLLIGGHGRRVVAIAARHADIFQFTGLTHGEGGEPSAGGFGIEDVRRRSRWLQEARSLPIMADKPKPAVREWTVEQKARVLADASDLDGEELTAYLQREGVKLAEYEQWRILSREFGVGQGSEFVCSSQSNDRL